MRRKRERFTLRNLFCMWLMRWERRNERMRNDGLSGALCGSWPIPPSFRCPSTAARALPAFPPLYKYLTEVEADEGRKEGRNASIKKIVVIAIIAAACRRRYHFHHRRRAAARGAGGGDLPSPSFHVIPTTSIEANENCRRNSRYFHFWMDGRTANQRLSSLLWGRCHLYRSIY